jgi:hypothetical protein
MQKILDVDSIDQNLLHSAFDSLKCKIFYVAPLWRCKSLGFDWPRWVWVHARQGSLAAVSPNLITRQTNLGRVNGRQGRIALSNSVVRLQDSKANTGLWQIIRFGHGMNECSCVNVLATEANFSCTRLKALEPGSFQPHQSLEIGCANGALSGPLGRLA